MNEEFQFPTADGSHEELLIYCDGGSRGNPGQAAIGAVILDENGQVLASVSEAIGIATNNVAEYKALLAALERAREFPSAQIRVRADSQLLIRQLQGEYKIKNAGLRPLFDQIRQLLSGYQRVTLEHVPREQNKDADALVNAALDALH